MGCTCSVFDEKVDVENTSKALDKPPSISGGRLVSNSLEPSKDSTGGKPIPVKPVRQHGHAPIVEEVTEKRKERFTSQSLQETIPKALRKSIDGEQVAAGWPSWLVSAASEAIRGWIPRRADSFEKLDKIGQGTYSNVYKARDLESGKLVALKKVRFDNLEPESVRFMAREIEVLRRLDHPNVIKLEGLVTSRMSCSLYLVFEYMEHDLSGLAACPGVVFTEAQVKCYMQQLINGLEHCHTRGILHRDIKGSNLLLDNQGILKIADFGLATFYRPDHQVPLTSRVVTLWYRPPELLLGATNYGVAVDLWSSGCILAELLAGKPIMPGRTEVEQLHKIFKLCGSPSEEYWHKSKLPHATIFKPTQPYKRCLSDVFKDFPSTALSLLDVLLSIEPADRGTATAAIAHDFFVTSPLPCDPSSLPQYPPSKEYDAKLRDEEARRQRAAGSRAGKTVDPSSGSKQQSKSQSQSRQQGTSQQQQQLGSKQHSNAAPLANAELVESIAAQKQQFAKQQGARSKSKSERFLSAAELALAQGVTGLGPQQGVRAPVSSNESPDNLLSSDKAKANSEAAQMPGHLIPMGAPSRSIPASASWAQGASSSSLEAGPAPPGVRAGVMTKNANWESGGDGKSSTLVRASSLGRSKVASVETFGPSGLLHNAPSGGSGGGGLSRFSASNSREVGDSRDLALKKVRERDREREKERARESRSGNLQHSSGPIEWPSSERGKHNVPAARLAKTGSGELCTLASKGRLGSLDEKYARELEASIAKNSSRRQGSGRTGPMMQSSSRREESQDKLKVDSRAWMLSIAGSELPPGVAEALAATREGVPGARIFSGGQSLSGGGGGRHGVGMMLDEGRSQRGKAFAEDISSKAKVTSVDESSPRGGNGPGRRSSSSASPGVGASQQKRKWTPPRILDGRGGERNNQALAAEATHSSETRSMV